MVLKQQWINLFSKYSEDTNLCSRLWLEIELKYQEKHRAYHNLIHIKHLFLQFSSTKINWEDGGCLAFSIWYHDIIYNPKKSDNELQSALLAKKRLLEIGLKKSQIELCYHQIMATKSHSITTGSICSDTPYLLDFDLKILSSDWPNYLVYTKQIREEYKIYPSFLYRKGRKKTLQHFLTRPYIYHTRDFRNNFEEKARKNIEKELELL